jgi:protein-tyrosine-phosphatase
MWIPKGPSAAVVVIATLMMACASIRADEPGQVLFVCEHGNVKSLMAASYFNQQAAARGLRLRAISRGSAPDSTTVPPPIVAGLKADGVEVGDFRPVVVSAADVPAAERVVMISTMLPAGVEVPKAKAERWDDVPAASVNYAEARDSLKAHVEQLLERLSEEASESH